MTNLGWDERADVVVVGGGGGLRAGLAAARSGAKTIVLEKTGDPGGKTAMSIGIMTASATSVQKAAGVTDSHARHLADVEAMARQAGAKIDVASTKGYALAWAMASGHIAGAGAARHAERQIRDRLPGR
jgi:fumarate reductase flavoprotein subunit